MTPSLSVTNSTRIQIKQENGNDDDEREQQTTHLISRHPRGNFSPVHRDRLGDGVLLQFFGIDDTELQLFNPSKTRR
jgi:hypothetical protein